MSVLPDRDFEATRGFWEAAARGQLAVPRCAQCSRRVWYPQARCPDCGGTDMPWEPVSGRGTLFSWVRVTRALHKPLAERAPYLTGLVALEEDPRVRIVTNFVDCEPGDLRMDMPVEVVFREIACEGERVVAPQFRPSRSAASSAPSSPPSSVPSSTPQERSA
jgi:uncharacterized OB-fold protein